MISYGQHLAFNQGRSQTFTLTWAIVLYFAAENSCTDKQLVQNYIASNSDTAAGILIRAISTQNKL